MSYKKTGNSAEGRKVQVEAGKTAAGAPTSPGISETPRQNLTSEGPGCRARLEQQGMKSRGGGSIRDGAPKATCFWKHQAAALPLQPGWWHCVELPGCQHRAVSTRVGTMAGTFCPSRQKFHLLTAWSDIPPGFKNEFHGRDREGEMDGRTDKP